MKAKQWLFDAVVGPTRFVRNMIDQPAVILLYHRVTQLTLDSQKLAVSPIHFSSHLDHLRKHYNVLSASEFLSYKSESRPFPPRSVLLTFDDGYSDNCTEALPRLEAHGLQAIFYVTTSLLDSDRESWWDELERLIYTPACPFQLGIELKGRKRTLSVNTDPDRETVYASLHHIIKYLPHADRENVLQSLRSASGLPDQGRSTHRFMSRHQVRTMAQSKAAVLGAHTHSHVPLNILSPDEQRSELLRSREILQEIAQTPILHCSYPYGLKKDYDRNSVSLCREMGFEMACANFYGQVHRWTNPFELPRIIVRDWPEHVFEEMLLRFFRY